MTSLQERALAEARTWLGTPYRHQASEKGVGCDCLGLIRGVWRAVVGKEPQAVPPYRPDWAETGGEETLLAAARAWLIEIDPDRAQPGDVVLFRMTPDAVVKHAGILSALATPAAHERRVIHAYWAHACVESWMGRWWGRRLSHAFRFPGKA